MGAVARAKSLTSVESIKSTVHSLKRKIKEREVLKYFSSRTEFAKLISPLTKRFDELVRKLRGQKAAATRKPESPLWLELTGKTKAEIKK